METKKTIAAAFLCVLALLTIVLLIYTVRDNHSRRALSETETQQVQNMINDAVTTPVPTASPSAAVTPSITQAPTQRVTPLNQVNRGVTPTPSARL